ncbi:MAG: hypothetical protein FD145_1444 [Candidatus Saganbacteria bacterium]|uniref:Uncharacterized protein n=1 Tax=Candidatus Saganbacteria bacterium TaxID=2575572 RepID=A0A833KZS8_UNCSA|nr:MAG: hypothetical protein FD145_1444 [Candidatus Saganbacteria bacterium]
MKKIVLAIFFIAQALAFGKELTRDEAMSYISKSEAIKKKESALFNFKVGYDISKINRVKLVPIIKYVKAAPIKVPPDGRTVVEVTAYVDDPSGPKNISGVNADLSSIGKIANMSLVDNGRWGDAIADDNIYTLQTNVNQQIPAGGKEIPVKAANKSGWIAFSKTSLEIDKNPTIIQALADPEKAKRGDNVSLIIKVENPGRIEDISGITVNLKELGLEEISLYFSRENIFTRIISIPSQIMPGIKKLPFQIINLAGGQASGIISLGVE